MKIKINSFLWSIGILLLIASCVGTEKSPVDSYGKDYDIPYPYPLVNDFPSSAPIGSVITIDGVNLDRTIVSVAMESAVLDTLKTTGTSVVVQLPRIFTRSAITVTNLYRKSGTSVKTISPIYPQVKVESWPNFIYRKGGTFLIKGENVDLITEVQIGDTKVSVSPGSSPNQVVVRTDGFNTEEAKVILKVTKAYGVINDTNKVSDSTNVILFDPTKIPPADPLVLWNFENDVTNFTAGDIVPSQGINLSGISVSTSVTGTKYFTVRALDVPSQWNTLIGVMERTTPIDLSAFQKEGYLTFLVNTNGKNGYMQIEITQGDIRAGAHFTGTSSNVPTDDYNFGITNGWEWRSVKLSNFNWENWFNDGKLTFDPKGVIQNFKLSFKQGNGGNGGNKEFEINLDQIMITDGPWPYPAPYNFIP